MFLSAMEFPSHQSSIQHKKKRKRNWYNNEILRLVNMVAEKRLIVNDRFRPSLTNADKKRACVEITNAVTASNVLVRRTEEVTNKWFSVLSYSRKKIAAIIEEWNQLGEVLFINVLIIKHK